MPDRQFPEIQVKSVLNRVEGMPFRWSINPYRGCSHGCVFCMSADTPILIADGTTKSLGEVRVGDRIYGTVKRGAYRRYVPTVVLARWTAWKPAYRVRLEDGTEIIVSGDHRLLSDRGWKFVTGAEQGPRRRPHLTTNNKLMGTGAFSSPADKTRDYKHGYLCGVVRGAAHLGFYPYPRVGRRHGHQYRFRLAMADEEALERAREYLTEVGVETRSFAFLAATATARALGAIRTSARAHIERIEEVIAWPVAPTLDWCKGFLAGIFDAEGSYRNGCIRIPNSDAVIIDCIAACLGRFAFRFVFEKVPRIHGKSLTVVRVTGGLREHLRFFHTVDPAITRKRTIDGQAVKNTARLRVAAIEPLGIDLPLVDITTGTGDFIANGVISHNCYARRTHWFLDEDGVNEWDTKVFVKVNAPDVLRLELSKPSWKRETVALGTATDPYQAIEGRYRITRRILEALRDFRTPVSIITRCPMIVRDLDILQDLNRRAGVTVCVSVATTDNRLARQIEPTVAPPAQRLRTVGRLAAAGIRTGVMLAPILPGLTDQPKHIEAVIRAARYHGARFIGHNVLHLGDVTKDVFTQFLRDQYPELLRVYKTLYGKKYAPPDYRATILRIVSEVKDRLGIREPRYAESSPRDEQLALFER